VHTEIAEYLGKEENVVQVLFSGNTQSLSNASSECALSSLGRLKYYGTETSYLVKIDICSTVGRQRTF